MKRREFLRALSGTVVGAGSFLLEHPFRPRLKLAQGAPTNGNTLVCIFQRGGCDGLNMVVPTSEVDYPIYRDQLRPTIYIPRDGDASKGTPAAIPLLGDPDLGDDFFGLHPSLHPLAEIWNNGDLAICPTTGYDGASRSHFTGQDRIERADGVEGWLNRHLASSEPPPGSPGMDRMRAAAISSSLPRALRGAEIVSVINDLTNFGFDFPSSVPDPSVEGFLGRLVQAYGQDPDPGRQSPRPNRELVHAFGNPLFRDVGTVNDIDVPPVPDLYRRDQQPNGQLTTFARQLYHTALLIKAGVGLELACLNIGGWDTHSNQGDGTEEGRQAQRFADFATGIKGFYDDLSASGHMQNTAVLTLTEFGRTARENGSAGTDHGNAWVASMVGGAGLNGGRFYMGTGWPGLLEAQLYRGRYLQHTLDYRDIMGDLLVEHLGRDSADLDNLLPGHTYSPVGFMS